MSTPRSSRAPYVERAGIDYGPAGLSADDLRHRARNAPPEVRALIDRQRTSRGLLPLWGRSTTGSSRPRAAERARALRDYLGKVRGEIADRTVDELLAARRTRRGA